MPSPDANGFMPCVHIAHPVLHWTVGGYAHTVGRVLGRDMLTEDAAPGARGSCRGAAMVGVLAVVLLLAPVTAGAAPTWLSPETLSRPSALNAQVAMDQEGNAVAVWTRQTGFGYTIEAAGRPAGGPWSQAQDIANDVALALAPQVALDAHGNAVAVWRQDFTLNGSGSTVHAAIRDRRGNWSPAPHNLGSADGFTRPELAVNPDGHAVAVWEDMARNTAPGALPGIRVASRPPNGAWTTAPNLSTTGWSPDVALDSYGNAVAVWGDAAGIKVASRTASGAWSPASPLADSGPPSTCTGPSGSRFPCPVRVALNPQGDAIAVWAYDGGIRVANRPVSGTWSVASAPLATLGSSTCAAQGVSGSRFPCGMRVAVNEHGDAVVVWAEGATTNAMKVASRVNGAWSTQSFGANAEDPHVALNSRGDATAVWYERHPGPGSVTNPKPPSHVLAINRPARGDWSQVAQISKSDVLPGFNQGNFESVAIDPQGNAVASWAAAVGPLCSPSGGGGNDSCYDAQAAGYDAAGPQLRNMQVPTAGTVGSPLSFSVSPVDVWSPVASTRWGFGDATDAEGTNVSHTYGAPGNYEAALTSRDWRGNSSTWTGVVGISPQGGSGAAPAQGMAQSRDGDSAASAFAAQARRASGLRSCLARAASRASGDQRPGGRRSARARAKNRLSSRRARQRCLKLYGRTPGQVRSLSTRRLSQTKIELGFLAAGTDGSHAPAAQRYLIKQSSRPIRSARDFARARTLCGGSCRFPVTRVGARLIIDITDLRPGRTYYYAIAARDNVSGRLGPRSTTVKVWAG